MFKTILNPQAIIILFNSNQACFQFTLSNTCEITFVLFFFYFTLPILFHFVYLIDWLGSFYLHILLSYEYTFNEKRHQNFDHIYEIQYVSNRNIFKTRWDFMFYVIFIEVYIIYRPLTTKTVNIPVFDIM